MRLPSRLVGLLCLLTLGFGWLATPSARAGDDDGSKIYQNMLRSTVWILSPKGGGKAATGTGSLVERQKGIVLTNYHVVGRTDEAILLFPAFTIKKELIAERKHYLNAVNSAGVPGKVIARDKSRDLALIQLSQVPDGARAVSISPGSASPGQNVHSVGNPGGSGALWVYTPGKVRQVYNKEWSVASPEEVMNFKAKIVETDSQTNPGDSGGPLVNEKGLLVGVTQGGAVGANALSTFIDVSEVRAFLTNNKIKVPTTAVATSTKPDSEPVAESKPAAKPAAPAASDDEKAEKAAQIKLKLVKQLGMGDKGKVRERLEQLIEQFPKTKAAGEAKVLLDQLK
jgi:S1-C subfamily serine protease